MPFIYPTAVELRSIQQAFVTRQRAGRVGLDIIAPQDSNFPKVRWSQKDNYFGLQQLRGMDGQPTRVQRVGRKSYEYEPGVFGEYIDITETELTERAGSLDPTILDNTPIDIGDLVVEADQELIVREWERMETSVWTLLVSGTISIKIAGPNGTQVGYQDTYTFLTYTPAIPWGTAATAVPIKDFQTIQQMGLVTGSGVDFGSAAKAYMNQVTANKLLNNANANDYNGRRSQYGATLNNVAGANGYFQGQNLPQIVVYDGVYIDDAKAVQKFIPDNKVVVIGARPGNVAIGNYLLTRNASAGFRPGSYRLVKDYVNGVNAPKEIPPRLEIHRGHNGGPAMYYPSAVLVMTVG